MSERSPQLVLASRSPRRAELLAQLQVAFRVVPVACDESALPGEAPDALVKRLAETKATLGHEAGSGLPVLGADTVVVIDGRVLGKPGSPEEGLSMLKRLNGRQHDVLTAVAMRVAGRGEVALSRSRVFFGDVDEEQLRRYWATGAGLDKAGGYGIQGIGGILVRRIDGSHSGVMGLPVYETEALLRAFGVDTWQYRGV